MKKHTKIFAAVGLCVLLVAGAWIANGAMRVQAQIANNLNPQDKSQTEQYLKKDSSAQIGTKENPFTIVEIVPNRSMARMGYLIPGCEPIDMDKLSKDEIADGKYKVMFVSDKDDDSNIAWQEDIVQDVFADQLPASATVREPWGEKEQQYKDMAPDDTNWVTTETNYGMWKFVQASKTETGYYEKLTSASGWFDMETDDNGSRFVYNSDHKGMYNWVEAENSGNAKTDYTEDKVWTTRTEPGYFETKTICIHNRDVLIQHAYKAATSDGFVSQVITLTPEDLKSNSNVEYIKSADLICISEEQDAGLHELWNLAKKDGQQEVSSDAPTVFGGDNDVPWKAVRTIVECMAGDDPPALLLSKTTYDSDKSVNLNKLAIMVLQYQPQFFMDYYMDKVDQNGTYTDENGTKHDVWVHSEDQNQNTFDLKYAYSKNISYGTSENVFGNVYAYSNFNIFTHGYTDKKYEENTSSVGNKEAFDWFEDETGKRPGKLSANDFIYFILHGKEYRTASELHILEVEPTNEFIGDVQKNDLSYNRIEDHIKKCNNDNCEQCKTWKAYYRPLLSWVPGDLKKKVQDGKVTITRMASWEFIGKIEDLSAEYDMIIFGATQNQANGKNGYNDSAMDGLIYSSIGDKVVTSGGEARERAGFTNMQSDGVIRYSGNDLTEKKVNELISFMNAGKPVIVDEDFYADGSTTVDVNRISSNSSETRKGTVDISSQAYQLFSQAGSNSHLYVSNLISQSNLLSDVLRNSCDIVFNTENGETGYPTEYSYTEKNGEIDQNSVQYVSGHTLTYKFKIMGSKARTYEANLYIDRNGDGIYKGSIKDPVSDSDENETEKIAQLKISDKQGNAVSNNELKSGQWYTISQTLPASYVGILPWKLEVSDVSNNNLRDNANNYCAIKTTAKTRDTIKVLQMNLTHDMNSQPTNELIMDIKKDKTGATAQKFDKYMKGVSDFEVTIDFMENAEWKKKFCRSGWSQEQQINAWKSYLDEYDMLILGFSDGAVFTDNQVYQAGFEYFVGLGKGVILSHDMCRNKTYDYMPYLSADQKGAIEFDSRIRDLMAQRRYDSRTWELQGRSVALTSGSNGNVEAGNIANYIWKYSSITKQKKDNNGNISYVPDYDDNAADLYLKFGPNTKYQDGQQNKNTSAKADRVCTDSSFENSLGLTKKVSLDNKGQITRYPYILDEDDLKKLDIANTHQQWHQLDMDNPDLVVWYNLSDNSATETGIYSSRENDARNQYYIYNVGNITYTGMGHSGNGETLPDSEVKLFVNTMISAYRSTTGDPRIVVTNPDKREVSSTESYLYAVIDPDNYTYDDDATINVTFKIEDTSWVKSRQETKVNALQFVSDENGTTVLSASEHPALYKKDGTKMNLSLATAQWGNYVYLRKPSGWNDNISCYVYSDSDGKQNADWPGVKMEKMSNGLFRYQIPNTISHATVMFSYDGGGNGKQYPGVGQPGFTYSNESMIADATKNWSWTKYSDSTAFDAYAVEIANDDTDKGNYYFPVSYKELMEKGQLDYYLCMQVKTTRADGKKVYSKRVTKISVLPVQLFNLD